jgi:hypothetical protein
VKRLQAALAAGAALLGAGAGLPATAQDAGRCPGGGSPPCDPPGGGTQVQIGALDDIRLGTWPGGGELVGEDSHCVKGPTPDGRFRLIARGDGPGNAFVLRSGTDRLRYRVAYDDGAGGYVQLSPNTPRRNLRGARNDGAFRACQRAGQGRERLRVRIPADELSAARAGAYQGTLTLTVEAP